MKMIGMATIFGMLASSFAVASGATQVYGGARGGRPPKLREHYEKYRGFREPRPTSPRWWHDNTDSIQTARFEVAEVKRRNRAQRLIECASNSVAFNKAHAVKVQEFHDERTYTVPNRLNPFYVAK